MPVVRRNSLLLNPFGSISLAPSRVVRRSCRYANVAPRARPKRRASRVVGQFVRADDPFFASPIILPSLPSDPIPERGGVRQDLPRRFSRHVVTVGRKRGFPKARWVFHDTSRLLAYSRSHYPS